jgi:hypothetical protein
MALQVHSANKPPIDRSEQAQNRLCQLRAVLVRDQLDRRQPKYCPEATLPWRDQLALEPVHYLFGLQGITELHRRLKLMRATMTFKGPKVIT